MNSLQLLTDFWKEATFEDFNKMMKAVLPHTGPEYRREKFGKFQRDLSGWLCELTSHNRNNVERYLKIRALAEASSDPIKQFIKDGPIASDLFEETLQKFQKDTLTTYLAVVVDPQRYASVLKNMAGIEELLFTNITEAGATDSTPEQPASETDELT